MTYKRQNSEREIFSKFPLCIYKVQYHLCLTSAKCYKKVFTNTDCIKSSLNYNIFLMKPYYLYNNSTIILCYKYYNRFFTTIVYHDLRTDIVDKKNHLCVVDATNNPCNIH